MMAYFDSSALVKLVIDEAGSDDAAALWDAADVVLASRVASPEVRAALAAAHRGRRLTDEQLVDANRLWAEFSGALRVVELTAEIARQAGDLAEEHALGGVDAIHLASALLLAGHRPVVATWDSRLHAAVRALDVMTLPDAP